ncbi:chemerin-like receptor 1 [Hemicordylus capensis]|uniref:chemerin-like receptor 1 n=1 Tax=Hemicordylus capensis TaxID=884348 RepID=UPI002304278B|nr:chemerin-like receptor 1 [Hemicordylus capensis]
MNASYARRDPTPVEEAMRHIAMVTNVIILILGVSGNGLVIWAIARRKKRNTFTSICYLNMAVADLLFSAGRIPALVQEIQYGRWPFGMVLCKLHSFARYLTVFTSVFILTLISVYRCLLVARPVWARNHRSLRFQAWMCTGAWLLAFALSVPYLVLRHVDIKDGAAYCVYRKDLKISTELPIRLSRFLAGFLIPFVIIASAYLVLTCKIRKLRWEGSHKTFTLVATIVVLFFACWLPHHVFVLISTLMADKGKWGVGLKLSNALAYLYCCINPVIYGTVGCIRSRGRRRRQQASFLGIFRKALTEDDESSTGPEASRSLSRKS